MWISRYLTENSFASDPASVGEIRSAGKNVSVSASREHRGLPVAVPYGIIYVPPIGSDSLVLPTDSGDICLGVVRRPDDGLEQGELMLYSSGGASIVLKNDGRVLINGRAVE